MRLLKQSSVLSLVNSYVVDSPQPSNLSSLPLYGLHEPWLTPVLYWLEPACYPHLARRCLAA